MKEKIIDLFGLDRDKILQNRKIPKTKFYELDSFNNTKKKIFTDEIKEINLLAILNEETINISAYKDEELNYSEFYFIHVDLKEKKNLSVITKTICRNIQNPLVLVYSFNYSILITTAIKRLNKTASAKQVLEEELTSPWILISTDNPAEKAFLAACNIYQFSYMNLYCFHAEITRLVYQSITIEILDEYTFNAKLDNDMLKSLVEEYYAEKRVITTLESELNKLVEFGDKVSVKQNIINTEKRIAQLKKRFKKFLEENNHAEIRK
jgi:hypothetical protein